MATFPRLQSLFNRIAGHPEDETPPPVSPLSTPPAVSSAPHPTQAAVTPSPTPAPKPLSVLERLSKLPSAPEWGHNPDRDWDTLEAKLLEWSAMLHTHGSRGYRVHFHDSTYLDCDVGIRTPIRDWTVDLVTDSLSVPCHARKIASIEKVS